MIRVGWRPWPPLTEGSLTKLPWRRSTLRRWRLRGSQCRRDFKRCKADGGNRRLKAAGSESWLTTNNCDGYAWILLIRAKFTRRRRKDTRMKGRRWLGEQTRNRIGKKERRKEGGREGIESRIGRTGFLYTKFMDALRNSCRGAKMESGAGHRKSMIMSATNVQV